MICGTRVLKTFGRIPAKIRALQGRLESLNNAALSQPNKQSI